MARKTKTMNVQINNINQYGNMGRDLWVIFSEKLKDMNEKEREEYIDKLWEIATNSGLTGNNYIQDLKYLMNAFNEISKLMPNAERNQMLRFGTVISELQNAGLQDKDGESTNLIKKISDTAWAETVSELQSRGLDMLTLPEYGKQAAMIDKALRKVYEASQKFQSALNNKENQNQYYTFAFLNKGGSALENIITVSSKYIEQLIKRDPQLFTTEAIRYTDAEGTFNRMGLGLKNVKSLRRILEQEVKNNNSDVFSGIIRASKDNKNKTNTIKLDTLKTEYTTLYKATQNTGVDNLPHFISATSGKGVDPKRIIEALFSEDAISTIQQGGYYQWYSDQLSSIAGSDAMNAAGGFSIKAFQGNKGRIQLMGSGALNSLSNIFSSREAFDKYIKDNMLHGYASQSQNRSMRLEESDGRAKAQFGQLLTKIDQYIGKNKTEFGNINSKQLLGSAYSAIDQKDVGFNKMWQASIYLDLYNTLNNSSDIQFQDLMLKLKDTDNPISVIEKWLINNKGIARNSDIEKIQQQFGISEEQIYKNAEDQFRSSEQAEEIYSELAQEILVG